MSNSPNGPESILSKLVERPFEFDFVQAVGLLQSQATQGKPGGRLVGYDNFPADEVVQFRVAPTLRNNACEVVTARTPEETGSNYELTVPFIGLIGVNGVLPHHYTQTVISRVKQNDYAMLDFYDMFHHRILSMFFRASVKYRLPYVYQLQAAESPSQDDSITQLLRCLVGLGESGLKRKLSISDDTFLFYGGHFADRPTAHSLERIVDDFLGLPTKVHQFQFEWLYIDPSEQSRLSAGANNRLGRDVVIGERVPSIETRFRVRVGPVDWRDFSELLPNSRQVTNLADLIRVYVGISLDFELQVAVNGRQIPPLVIASEQPQMLGWTTWLFSKPSDNVVDDAVFDIGTF